MVGQTVVLSASSGSSVVTTVSGTTNSSGVATFVVSDTQPDGLVIYTARDTTRGDGQPDSQGDVQMTANPDDARVP